jgi:hypothetical protein
VVKSFIEVIVIACKKAPITSKNSALVYKLIKGSPGIIVLYVQCIVQSSIVQACHWSFRCYQARGCNEMSSILADQDMSPYGGGGGG